MNAHAQTAAKRMATTASGLPGVRITGSLGIVRGIVVRSSNIVGAMFGGLRSICGGNIGVFRDRCDKARRDACSGMVDPSVERGANAVIMVRCDATGLQAGITAVLAHGTAVTVVAA